MIFPASLDPQDANPAGSPTPVPGSEQLCKQIESRWEGADIALILAAMSRQIPQGRQDYLQKAH
jgi:hypothetical protein